MGTPLQVLYCGICTAPPEYCSYGPSFKRCKPWLRESHPDMYARLYGAEEEATTELQEKTADLKIDNSEKADKAKEQPQPEKLDALQKEQLKKDKKKQEARVTIKRIERTKRKCVIVVAGMEAFDVDLKKAAKLFATKFACGSSVTKNAAGVEEIVVQGDVQDDIYELILKTYKAIPDESVVMD